MSDAEKIIAVGIAEEFVTQAHLRPAKGAPITERMWPDLDPEDTPERRVDRVVLVHFTASDGVSSMRAPTASELAKVAIAALASAGFQVVKAAETETEYGRQGGDRIWRYESNVTPEFVTHQRSVFRTAWLPVQEEDK